MYNYYLDTIAINQMMVMAIFFFIILLFGNIEYKLHSLFIFTSSALAYSFAFDSSIIPSTIQYTDDLKISILWDGAIALVMVALLTVDKVAPKQAKLLAFAVMCHLVVSWNEEIYSSFIGFVFYYWYDELIIVVGLLQMRVSKNGFTGAFSNLQELLFRFFHYSHSLGKGLLARKEKARKF